MSVSERSRRRTSDSWDWTFWIHRTLGELKISCLILHISELEKSVQLWYLFAWKWDMFVIMSPRPRLSVLIWIFVSRVLCPPNCWCGHDGDWIWRLHRSRRLEIGTRARLSPPASVPETTHGPGHHWSPWHRRLCDNFYHLHLHIPSWWDRELDFVVRYIHQIRICFSSKLASQRTKR